MPSSSAAQRKKMALLYQQGKITREQWKRFQKIAKKRK